METKASLNHSWHGDVTEIAIMKATPSTGSQLPGLVWLGGFKSDMDGTKAVAMVDEASKIGCNSLRFDYSGHGQSGGEFVDGTISRWVDESLNVLLSHTEGPQILVGSSMGGWIALRLVQELKTRKAMDRLAGLLLIAPAPDFATRLMEPAFSDEQRQEMKDEGFISEPSEYSDEPNIITRKLIEDGRNNQVMTGDLAVGVPVRILQGMEDPDVPYTHALQLVEYLAHDDVQMTLIKDGDHRLSRDEDIGLLQRTITQMVTAGP
ncbi:MAG: alpha/beta hydrolase [Rhizobiaceae bacterium]